MPPDQPASEPGEEFSFGPAWARDTRCCAKPRGCTNMSEDCVLRNHPWKRAHARPPEPGPAEAPFTRPPGPL